MSHTSVVNSATETLQLQRGRSLLIFQEYSLFLACVASTTAALPSSPHTHIPLRGCITGTNGQQFPFNISCPCVCVCVDSVDGDYTIKAKFHPQVLFHCCVINLQCSPHSSSYFVIKCCNLLARHTYSLSTCPQLQLMLPCISQYDFKQFPLIRNQLVAFTWLRVGGESRSQSKTARFVPIKKKWVTLFSQNATCLKAAMHYGLSTVGGEIHTPFLLFNRFHPLLLKLS